MKKNYNLIKKGCSWSKTGFFMVLWIFAITESVAQITLTPIDSFEIDTNQFNRSKQAWRPYMGLITGKNDTHLLLFNKNTNRLVTINTITKNYKLFKIDANYTIAVTTEKNVLWVYDEEGNSSQNYIRKYLFTGDTFIEERTNKLNIKGHEIVPLFQTSEPYQMLRTSNNNIIINLLRSPQGDSSSFDNFNFYNNEAFYNLSPNVATFHINKKSAEYSGWFSNFPEEYKKQKFISYLFYNSININPRNKEVYVMYPVSHKISRYSFKGKHLGDFGEPSKHLNVGFEYPGYMASSRTYSDFIKDSLKLVTQQYRIMYVDSLHNLLFVAAHPSGSAPDRVNADNSKRKNTPYKYDNLMEAFKRKKTALQIYDLSKPTPELIYDELISDGYFFEIAGIQGNDVWVFKYDYLTWKSNPKVVHYKLDYK